MEKDSVLDVNRCCHLPFYDTLSRYRGIRPGYRTTLSGIVYTLTRKGLFLRPVEVLATRAASRAPFTKTNISQEEIKKTNMGQDLPFLLNATSNVVVNSDAGNGVGYTGMRIRGSDLSRINVTLNGIPYNDAESQGVFFVDRSQAVSLSSVLKDT